MASRADSLQGTLYLSIFEAHVLDLLRRSGISRLLRLLPGDADDP